MQIDIIFLTGRVKIYFSMRKCEQKIKKYIV